MRAVCLALGGLCFLGCRLGGLQHLLRHPQRAQLGIRGEHAVEPNQVQPRCGQQNAVKATIDKAKTARGTADHSKPVKPAESELWDDGIVAQTFDHLHTGVWSFLDESQEDRITRLYMPKWVSHAGASEALARMEHLLRHPPCGRMPSSCSTAITTSARR